MERKIDSRYVRHMKIVDSQYGKAIVELFGQYMFIEAYTNKIILRGDLATCKSAMEEYVSR